MTESMHEPSTAVGIPCTTMGGARFGAELAPTHAVPRSHKSSMIPEKPRPIPTQLVSNATTTTMESVPTPSTVVETPSEACTAMGAVASAATATGVAQGVEKPVRTSCTSAAAGG
eukprot:CAMPEP_0183578294 /NCGR_PEP_ID=MMETSP0371-20130417/141525_1 /TAXON_ID=268820 /ORGANISM="Peridinium aciculiferum, Strain PAER-2" /LENGTH=114 /DNA_ID=CAMNT_0025788705 /DNA_START=33 /DNA_END=374 /DNA_ORIENTATION=+